MPKKTIKGSRGGSKSAKNPAKRVSKKALLALAAARKRRIIAAAALAATLALAVFARQVFLKSVVPDAREFTIRPGAGVSVVARDLNQGALFMALVNWRGGKLMAGTYDLPRGASVWKLSRMLARGEIAAVSITIPEGVTSRQIARLLGACEDAASIRSDGE